MLQAYIAFWLKAIGPAFLAAVVIGLAANKGWRVMMGVFSFVATGALFFNPIPLQKAAEVSEKNYFASIADDCKPGIKPTIIKAFPPSGVIKFGASGDVSNAGLDALKTMLRMKRTEPGHQAERIEMLEIKDLERPPVDVYPLVMHRLNSSFNFTVLSPVDGTPIIYGDVPRHGIGIHHYVDCKPVPWTSERIDTPERQAILAFLYATVSPNSTSPAPAVSVQTTQAPNAVAPASVPVTRATILNRPYMIQAGVPLLVMDDCSRGITTDPKVDSGLDLEYKHRDGDLVVLVLNREKKRESEVRAYCDKKDPPLLWQFYDHVLTCKGYMSDSSKAGPVFHASGYEETVQRIKNRADGNQYFEFDYGAYREISCVNEITTGPIRSASSYALQRKGNDLVVHDSNDTFGNSKEIPLFACKNYFQMPIDKAAKVTLGAGGLRGAPITIEPQQLRTLQDGQFFGRPFLADTPKSGKVSGNAVPVPPPAPTPAPMPPPQGAVCK